MSFLPSLRRALVALAMAACVLGLAPITSAQAAGSGSVTVTALRNVPTAATPRSGVVFTIGRVAGVDPTTPAGQARFLELQQQLAISVPALIDVRTIGATGELGTVSTSGLDDGVYVLRESGISDGVGGVLADQAPYADILFAIPMLDAHGVPVRSLDVMPKPSVQTPTPQPSQPVVPTPPPATATLSPRPAPSTPAAPGIDTGGGTEFEAATQWAMVVAGLSVLSMSFLATRRKASDQQ